MTSPRPWSARSRRCRCATCATWTRIRPTSGCARSGRSSGTRAWRPGSSCRTTAARSWSAARTCSRSRPARCPGAAQIVGRRDFRSLVGGAARRRSIAPSRMPGGPDPDRARWRWRPSGRWSPIGSPAWPKRDRFELFADFARLLPIAVIARVLGLPDADLDTLDRAKTWMEAVLAWRHSYGEDPRRGRRPSRRPASWSRSLLDTVRARRDRPRGRRHQPALGGRPRGRARLGRAGRDGQRQVHVRGRLGDDGVPDLQRRPTGCWTCRPTSARRRWATPGRSPASSRRSCATRRSSTCGRAGRRRMWTSAACADPAGRAGHRGQRRGQPRPGPLGAARRAGPGPAAAVGPPRLQRGSAPLRRRPPGPDGGDRGDRSGCGGRSRTWPAPRAPPIRRPIGFVSRAWRPVALTHSRVPEGVARARIEAGPPWSGSVPPT